MKNILKFNISNTMPSSNSEQIKDPKCRGEAWSSLLKKMGNFIDFFQKVYNADISDYQKENIKTIIDLMNISFDRLMNVETLTQNDMMRIKEGVFIEASRLAKQAEGLLNQNL